MTKKRVLLIGMLDSIHIARWVEQFQNTNVEIILFPSTHFKKIHPHLQKFDSGAIRVFGLRFLGRSLGYFDTFLTLRFFSNGLANLLRLCFLKLVVFILKPEIIHAVEIQHAGYLASKLKKSVNVRILTNWGSDIYYFQNFVDHKAKIRRALKWATHYSAECERDYQLANEFGFRGINLPRIPNAGGFDEYKNQIPCGERNSILVKTYGGQFGAGEMAIKAIDVFLEKNDDFKVFFFSVTSDLVEQIKKLVSKYPNLVSYSTLRYPLTQEAVMEKFLSARVYLGCSRSDGLSTSFLQAICTGSYPIQTNTSCASELTQLGAVGSVIPAEIGAILVALNSSIFDSEKLNSAQSKNIEFARTYLTKLEISKIAKSFYLALI